MARLPVFRQLVLIVLGTLVSINCFSQLIPPELPDTVKQMSDLGKVQYLGNLCWSLNAQNNDLAVEYGKYALNLADSLNFDREIAVISGYMGVAMLYYQNDIKKAWYYFRNALEHSIYANDSTQIGFAHDNIGYMYFLHGNLTSAIEYYREAFNVFERIDNKRGLAYVNTSIGLVHNAEGDFEKAFDRYNKALFLHKQENNLAGQAAVHSCLGETYLNLEKFDEAQKEFENQIEISQQINNDKYLAEGLKGIAHIWFLEKDFSAALEFIDHAIEIADSKHDDYLIIEARIIKAMIFGGLNSFEEGLQQLESAFETAKKLGLPQKIYEVYEGYSAFYDFADGAYQKDYSIYGDLFNVYDSLYREYEKEKLLNEEQQIEIVKNLEETRALLTQKRKQQLYFYVVLFLLIIVGGILYWRYYTSKSMSLRLANLNQELNNSIAEKNKALVSLEKSKQELMESDATKSKLFSIIAHDLKSPFHSILGFAEILKEEQKLMNDESREKIILNMHQGLRQLYSLLDNLLLWAATQTNKIQFLPRKENVSKAIAKTIQLHEIAADNKNVELKVKIEENVRLEVDLNLLNTVVRNLLSNAIKFTPEGGSVEVFAKIEDQNEQKVFLFSVTDTGVGIPENKLSGLFNADKNNISTSGTNSEKGTGLGLQLCFDLVKLHDGHIWAESEVNKGSRFTFTIPVKS